MEISAFRQEHPFMADLRWMSMGGTLLDGNGDLATTLNSVEELESMVASRVKAAVDGWKLYTIGAGLEVFPGMPVNINTELSIQRAITSSLTRQFLSAGSFTIQTLAVGNSIEAYIYLNKTLLTSIVVTL
jgi:hypothetical protein